MEVNASSAAFLGEKTEANITLRNQLESPFLRLPAELRNKIYIYVGLSTTIPVLTRTLRQANGREYATLLKYLHPNLLNTCKQVRQEGSSLLYKYAIFDLSECGFIPVLFHDCDDNCCERMTYVKVGWRLAEYAVQKFLDKDDNWSDEHMGTMSVLPNVKTIRIESDPTRKRFKDSRVRAALRAWCKNDTAEVIFEDVYDGVRRDGYWDHIQSIIV